MATQCEIGILEPPRLVGEAADGAGHMWRVEDIRETAVIEMLPAMDFTSVLALVRLFR